ncbi:MAG: LPP20 family lipoprotein [Treponema sp.]|jgi:hypothetical protein|nr:LPP20 family lipoprotein [Treponema sp.]
MKKTTCGTAAVLIVAVMVLMIPGCSTSASGVARSGEMDLPDWVFNPDEDETLIFGMGTMASSNESRGWKAAENRARTSISYQITAIVEGMQIDYQQQAGTDGNEAGLNFFEDVGRQLTANALNGARVAKRGVGNGGRYYVLMSYPVSAAKEITQGQIDVAANRAEIKARQAIEAMDRAFAARRSPSLVESGE